MAKRSKGISKKQLEEILQQPFYNNNPRGKAAKARVENEFAGDSCPLQKRAKSVSLVKAAENSASVLNIDVPLLIRLVRLVPKGRKLYDDDNWIAACKQLRDSATSLLGLPGDDFKDGIEFEYEQRKIASGAGGIEIEIYQL